MSLTVTATTDTPARDLPMGLVFDLCEVLDAYGLHVTAEELNGRGITEVMTAMVRVIDAIPEAQGGRRVTHSASTPFGDGNGTHILRTPGDGLSGADPIGDEKGVHTVDTPGEVDR